MHDFQFYVQPDEVHDRRAVLRGEERDHCCRVLRKRVGDVILLFDGNGNQYEAEISAINKDTVECLVHQQRPKQRRIFPEIHLGICVVKNAAFDEVLTTALALGVHTIYPLTTQHSVKQHVNPERMRKIVLNSVKQSGCAYLPTVSDLSGLANWLISMKNIEIKLVAEKDNSHSLASLVPKPREIDRIAALIDPEGGLSGDEIDLCRAAGFSAVNLFPYRLRTELATAVMISQLYQYYSQQGGLL
ncbi:MAG: RsmE family RNA methyltransferase [Candidatus Neomarinimicrobiota bacterium]